MAGPSRSNGLDILGDDRLAPQTRYLPQEFGAYPHLCPHDAQIPRVIEGIHGSQQQQVVENLLTKTNLWDA